MSFLRCAAIWLILVTIKNCWSEQEELPPRAKFVHSEGLVAARGDNPEMTSPPGRQSVSMTHFQKKKCFLFPKFPLPSHPMTCRTPCCGSEASAASSTSCLLLLGASPSRGGGQAGFSGQGCAQGSPGGVEEPEHPSLPTT